MSAARNHEDVVAAVGFDHANEFVAGTQVECDDAVATRRVVFIERRLFDLALTGGKEEVAFAGELARVDDGLDVFARLQRQQVDDGNSLRRTFAFGNVGGTQLVHASPVREEQQIGVCCGEDDVTHDVVGLQLGTGDAATTAALCAE